MKREVIKSEFIKTRNTIELGATGGVEFGAKVEILPEVESVVFDIKAYGKASLTQLGSFNLKTTNFNLFI